MLNTDAVAFMVADRSDLANACVAASTFRRYQPGWSLQLFVRGNLPPPWLDLSAGCFDQRVSLHSFPPLKPADARSDGALCTPDLASALRELFGQGAQRAIYLDHRHVWFHPLPKSCSDGRPMALWSTALHRESGDEYQRLALLSLNRLDDFEGALKRYPLLPEAAHEIDVTQSKSYFQSVVGLAVDDLSYAQLHFDSRGQLQWGDKAVLSACLGRPYKHSRGSVADIIWLELEKWYVSQLERFEQHVL